jgi:hypothetical protein
MKKSRKKEKERKGRVSVGFVTAEEFSCFPEILRSLLKLARDFSPMTQPTFDITSYLKLLELKFKVGARFLFPSSLLFL